MKNRNSQTLKQMGWLPDGLDRSQLLNLRQMLEAYAPEYVSIGAAFQSISDNLDIRLMPEEAVEDSRRQSILKALATILGCCREIHLKVSAGIAQNLYDKYREAAPTYQRAALDIDNLRFVFELEFKDKNFFFVPAERYDYFSNDNGPFEDGLGEKIAPFRSALETFPSADYDVREAGNCFAFARYTASAFHLIRVLEVGLKAISKEKQVPYTSNSNWGACIADIEKSGHLDPFLKEAVLYLRGVKNVWRNPTMHVERAYSQEEAKNLFQAVQVFMAHLATRLTEEAS